MTVQGFLKKLKEYGFDIKIFNEIGYKIRLDWYEKTQSQLDEWGLKYHELRTGSKISADIYIDDKGKNSEDFFKRGDY